MNKIKIQAENLGKKFTSEWIFRNFNYEFSVGTPTAITGPNGSGKSTLLQVLSGCVVQTEGTLKIENDTTFTPIEDQFNQFVIASPALELIEELTLNEALQFHQKFKKLSINEPKAFADAIQLTGNLNKPIKYFSSGMKQRLKLGFAFLAESPILLFDEPTSNLDFNGINWYYENILKLIDSKLIIISSNQPSEYDFCKNVINIVSYKN